MGKFIFLISKATGMRALRNDSNYHFLLSKYEKRNLQSFFLLPKEEVQNLGHSLTFLGNLSYL